mmetsp:Transcript_225/g.304  ORF Transcript_225/g.304 Transcript_225/m.304 type:complete len:203 (-) Transcript_225:81-689(-)
MTGSTSHHVKAPCTLPSRPLAQSCQNVHLEIGDLATVPKPPISKHSLNRAFELLYLLDVKSLVLEIFISEDLRLCLLKTCHHLIKIEFIVATQFRSERNVFVWTWGLRAGCFRNCTFHHCCKCVWICSFHLIQLFRSKIDLEGWECLHTQVLCERLRVVYIHFQKNRLVVVLRGQRLKVGSDLVAWSAPHGVEVDDHRLVPS